MDYLVLMDGRRVNIEDLDFDVDTHRFFWNGQDVTNLVKRTDKKRFPGFDESIENLRIYKEQHPGVPETGSTSILGNFVHQIVTDPLDAPLEALQRGVGNALETTTGKVVIALVFVGVIAILMAAMPRRP